MKQITLNINENKFQVFLEFLKTLDYIEVQDSDDSLNELQASMNQVKLMRDGELEKQTINDFLDEL